MKNEEKQNLLDMVQGGVKERVQIEFDKCIDNIMDVNADVRKKRVISLKIELVPDAERKRVNVSFLTDSKLAPLNPISTAVFIGADNVTGEMAVMEMTPQIPGQRNFEGNEQPEGKVIPITTKQALAN